MKQSLYYEKDETRFLSLEISIILNCNNLREVCIDKSQNNNMALSELLHYVLCSGK